MDNTQQLFVSIIYLKKFVLAVVVALPSYMLKVPISILYIKNTNKAVYLFTIEFVVVSPNGNANGGKMRSRVALLNRIVFGYFLSQ